METFKIDKRYTINSILTWTVSVMSSIHWVFSACVAAATINARLPS